MRLFVFQCLMSRLLTQEDSASHNPEQDTPMFTCVCENWRGISNSVYVLLLHVRKQISLLSIKGGKIEENRSQACMAMNSGTSRSDYFTFSLPGIIYFHSIASLFVSLLLMWLHIGFLCFYILNHYRVTFKVQHPATQGSLVPLCAQFV